MDIAATLRFELYGTHRVSKQNREANYLVLEKDRMFLHTSHLDTRAKSLLSSVHTVCVVVFSSVLGLWVYNL